ncbi:SICA antigen [Plasmodium coatneyi]|uniref:SICA antigen n=1 Tax=Plasmodium coatneyi TaxID=208452 RepID=A0A1B1E2H3_9APIC|nr:SICA antigen [Plasmodium coatneyi]ANQ09238.1 SICA antigen [Plasmodium coatneyi]
MYIFRGRIHHGFVLIMNNDVWGDINKEAKNMFTKISEDRSKTVPGYCTHGNTEPTSRIVTDPEEKACQYITKGLEHIYSIDIDQSDIKNGIGTDAQKRAEDDRLFKQAMLCFFLNAYADKLKEKVISPCTVGEDSIAQAFQRGNGQLKNWCKYKSGNSNDCVPCDRVSNLNCDVGVAKVKDKLETIIDNDTNITATLTHINSQTKSLCQRAQCVITQRTRDKRTERDEQGNAKVTAKEENIWEVWKGFTFRIRVYLYRITVDAAWSDAKGDLLVKLSEAMTMKQTEEDALCNNINGEAGKTATYAEKKACNYIVKGLKHIHSLQGDIINTNPKYQKNNRLFEQTMACLILNEYGRLLQEKSCIDKRTVESAFNIDGKLHKTACTGGNCDQCNWDPCSDFKIGKEDKRRKEIKKKLEEDENIQKTFTTIHNASNLCERVKCVTEKWGKNRVNGAKPAPWSNFWPNDVKNQLVNISGGMLQEKPNVDKECNSIPGLDSTNKEACNYIVRGLDHIYKIEKGKNGGQKMIQDNLIFHRTMSCVLLNAFADKLIERTNGHMCPITEEEIKKMFQRGNGKMGEWCKDKHGQDMECEMCDREPSLVCEVSGGSNTYTVKTEVNNLFNGNNGAKITETLTTINNINNTLCARANCVTTNWFKDRDEGGGKQDWCTYWDTDFKNRLMELSKDMTNNSKNMNNYCNNVGNEGSAEKKACVLITAGLKHIYEIKKDEVTERDPTEQEKKEKKAVHNVQFEQVMKCILLNEYVNKIKDKCKDVKEENKIIEMFQKGNDQMNTWCKERKKNGEANCIKCEREENLNCTLSVNEDLFDKGKSERCEIGKGSNRAQIRTKLKELFQKKEKEGDVKKVMEEINTICTVPPAPPIQPATAAKPAGGDGAERGRSDPEPPVTPVLLPAPPGNAHTTPAGKNNENEPKDKNKKKIKK